MDMDSPCQPASAGQEAVARFFIFLLQVVATWNIVGLLVERVAPGVADAISEAFWLTNISADPSLIWGLVNGLLASGFMRRQRAAMIGFVVIFQASTIALAVPLIPMWEDFVDVGAGEEQLSFYLFLGGTAFALVSVILLLWSLPAFPARLARGAWLRALAVGIGGAAIGYIYAYLSAVMAHHMPYLAAAK